MIYKTMINTIKRYETAVCAAIIGAGILYATLPTAREEINKLREPKRISLKDSKPGIIVNNKTELEKVIKAFNGKDSNIQFWLEKNLDWDDDGEKDLSFCVGSSDIAHLIYYTTLSSKMDSQTKEALEKLHLDRHSFQDNPKTAEKLPYPLAFKRVSLYAYP